MAAQSSTAEFNGEMADANGSNNVTRSADDGRGWPGRSMPASDLPRWGPASRCCWRPSGSAVARVFFFFFAFFCFFFELSALFVGSRPSKPFNTRRGWHVNYARLGLPSFSLLFCFYRLRLLWWLCVLVALPFLCFFFITLFSCISFGLCVFFFLIMPVSV